MIRFSHVALVFFLLAGMASATITWRPLWDGKTLDGWHNRGKDAWTVEKETPASAPALHGKHASATDDYSMLYTDKSYAFFTMHVTYKMLTGNSGVYVKSKELDKTPFVAGIQVDLNAPDGLSLYCTSCGAGVYAPPADVKARISKTGYNVLTITVKGDSMYNNINGADMAPWNFKGKEAFVLPSGPFGLQLHDARLDEVWFKDIEIMEGCTDKASPRYDKETENPRLYVTANPTDCAAPTAIGSRPGSPAQGTSSAWTGMAALTEKEVRFVPGRVEVGVSGAYQLTIRNLAGQTLALRNGTRPQGFPLPEIRSAGAYLVTLENHSMSQSRWQAILAP